MAISRIILLTGAGEAPILAAILRAYAPGLIVDAATTADDLAAMSAGELAGTRLVSFCSAVIVPGALLARLPGPAYNFHPGPPEYPGRFPSIWALYDGAARFGITVHEMLAKVDAGPIVAADWFDIPRDCGLTQLEELAFACLADRFRAMAPHLAVFDRPLIRMPYRWGRRKTTKADADALRRVTPDMDAAEIARRERACGGVVMQR